jgi:nitroreductase
VEALEAIRARRSIGRLVAPAPADDELRTILEAAACAPDHGELRPWRFTVLRDEGMQAFGKVLEEAYRGRCQRDGVAVVEAKAAKERTKLGRAPLVVVVAAVRGPTHKIPWVEQFASAAAAAENALLAATALGYGSMWRTGDPAYDDSVKQALGLGADDAVVGYLYLGTATPEARAAKPPHEPDLTGLVVEWAP